MIIEGSLLLLKKGNKIAVNEKLHRHQGKYFIAVEILGDQIRCADIYSGLVVIIPSRLLDRVDKFPLFDPLHIKAVNFLKLLFNRGQNLFFGWTPSSK